MLTYRYVFTSRRPELNLHSSPVFYSEHNLTTHCLMLLKTKTSQADTLSFFNLWLLLLSCTGYRGYLLSYSYTVFLIAFIYVCLSVSDQYYCAPLSLSISLPLSLSLSLSQPFSWFIKSLFYIFPYFLLYITWPQALYSKSRKNTWLLK